MRGEILKEISSIVSSSSKSIRGRFTFSRLLPSTSLPINQSLLNHNNNNSIQVLSSRTFSSYYSPKNSQIQFYRNSLLNQYNNIIHQQYYYKTISTSSRSNSNTSSQPVEQVVNSGTTMKPAGIEHNWDLRQLPVKQVEEKCSAIIEHLKSLFDKAASAEVLSYETVLKPLLDAHRYSSTHGALVTFPRHVVESQPLRDAASQATKLLDDASVEMSMRKDIYDKLVEYKENYSANDNLSPEYQRCLERLIHNGRRNGLHLSEEIQEQVKALKKQISQLTLQFGRNLGEDNTIILLAPEELEGMSPSFLEGLEKDVETGKYKVSLKYDHFFPLTRNGRVPETRRKLEVAYQSKCMKENTAILEEVLALRQKESTLLGYANHAEYAQDTQMANPEKVKEFLADLALKLQPLWESEKQMMLELKKEECEKYNYEYQDKLEMWDFRYYMCRVEEKHYAVDQQTLMGYFPLEVVTQGMLGIYEDLLSLKFTQLPEAQKWHDDVQVYQVNDRKTMELLGYFYLDVHPREGKFGHACCVPLQPGCLDENGIKVPAVSAMLCNFSRPKNNKPSLLDHKEVETYFHEFGHLMHTICSKAKTALLFGTRVETDFLEAPSQMLENWVWEKEPLRRMSLHYEKKEPLPEDLCEKLAASQVANAGGLNLRQVSLATFDQWVHTRDQPCNTQALYAQCLHEIMGLEAIPNTNMPANFNHLCIGYSGRYYSYLWSEVFSMDMYKTVFKEQGILNPETGMLYRKTILEPGGSIDAVDMLKNFLGREPNNRAFLESKGLNPDAL